MGRMSMTRARTGIALAIGESAAFAFISTEMDEAMLTFLSGRGASGRRFPGDTTRVVSSRPFVA